MRRGVLGIVIAAVLVVAVVTGVAYRRAAVRRAGTGVEIHFGPAMSERPLMPPAPTDLRPPTEPFEA